MKNNMKLINKYFVILFFFILIPFFAFAEGQGCEFFPDDPEMCPPPGAGAPLPPRNPGLPSKDNPVKVSITPSFSILPNQSFNIEWSAEWFSAEADGGQNIYTVLLYRDGLEIKRWVADTNNSEQALETGNYFVGNGVDKNTDFSVEATLEQVTNGRVDNANDSMTVSIGETSNCTITSFTADSNRVNSGESTTLRFALNKNGEPANWSIQLISGSTNPTKTSGFGAGDVASTGPLTTTQTYRLRCDTSIRDVTVEVVGSSSLPSTSGGGGGGWCGSENSNPIGPRINVPTSYKLLDTCWVGDYSDSGEHYGIPGAEFSFNGGCTPPTGTGYIVAEINMDDGGEVYINGTQVYSVAPTCSIKNNQIEVSNMPVGQPSDIIVNAVNSGLAGVGADIDFYFYRTSQESSLTPVLNTPSCSNTNYSATISWEPVAGDIRIFIDNNLNTPDAFDKVVNGGAGSTPAPEGFSQRLPGGPQVLKFEPGNTYYSFIQKGDAEGPVVAWSVNACLPGQTSGTISASPVSCLITNGNSSCNTSLSWNTENPVGTSAVTKIPNITVATGNNSSGLSVPIAYGGERFFLYNNATELDSITVGALCDSSTVWIPALGICSSSGNTCPPGSGPSCGGGSFCPDGSLPPCAGGGGFCSNGATNYPICTTNGGGACINGAPNPPICFWQETCSNGATNWPTCTLGGGGECLNGASNPPVCSMNIGGGRVLRINKSNVGVVTSADSIINCGGGNNSCSHIYSKGSLVSIRVNPSSSYWKFNGWASEPSGLCSGSITTCNIVMDNTILITPIFTPRIFDYREF